MLLRTLAGTWLAILPVWADVRGCQCDVAQPQTLEARECGLCKEAEKQPATTEFFFVKDINPRKANRTLALPRFHVQGPHELGAMSPAQHAGFWTAAVGKARELWGDKWGLAVNGILSRTQCHAHIHIGRLLEGVETDNFVMVDSPAKIPASEDGNGVWVHPVGNQFHVHRGEMITETVLLR